MVAVQMADKNIKNALMLYFVSHQLAFECLRRNLLNLDWLPMVKTWAV